MRANEVIQLEWPTGEWNDPMPPTIDFDQALIRVTSTHTKTKKPRLVPLSQYAAETLLTLWEARKGKKIRSLSNRLFLAPAGQPVAYSKVEWPFRQARKKTGIVGLWLHDLKGT